MWPPGSERRQVWAVLDCARDDRIYPLLRTSGLDYLCLFSGRLPPSVQAVAPYLVEVSPAFALTLQLIDLGWGRSWGIFLSIDDPSNLRHHLRGFLRVRDESGRILLFRFYDPRVLRVYLPTCRRDELRTIFGPVTRYMVEGETGKELLEFEFDGEQLHERRVDLAGPALGSHPVPA
jgi:hypothetical protein